MSERVRPPHETPTDRLREMELELLKRSAVFGFAMGALYRIAQGLERPEVAARHALSEIGWHEGATLAAPPQTDGNPNPEQG